ncbi:hypothetical protein [Phyllobacterium sp. P5_D12]
MIRTLASVGGLGGCPYAKGATGNVSTEELVYMLEGMGVSTGVDLPKLGKVAVTVSSQLGRRPVSSISEVPAEKTAVGLSALSITQT